MRALTDHEKRTIRLGAIGLGVYLVLFYGARGWGALESRRLGYEKLVKEAQVLKVDLQRRETKALQLEKLKKRHQLDPRKLSSKGLVAEASAAIQRAAAGGGVVLGMIRESPARASAKELASMHIEAMGPVPALTGLLHRLTALGYPLVLDSVQFSQEQSRPGMLKLSLTVVILDFEQWKKVEARRG